MYNDDYPNDFEESGNETGAGTEGGNSSSMPTQDGGSGRNRQEGHPYRNYYDERYRGGQNGYQGQSGHQEQNGYQGQSGHQGQNGYQGQSGHQGQNGYQGQNAYQEQSGSQDQSAWREDGQSRSAENDGRQNTGGSYHYQQGGGGGYQNGGNGGQNGFGYHDGSDQNGGRHDPKPRKKTSGAKIAAAVLLVAVFVGFCGGISWLAVSSLEDQLTNATVEESAAAQPEGQDEYVEAEPQQPAAPQQSAGTGGGQIASAGTVRESGSVTAVVTDVTDVVEKVMPACVSITNNYTEQVQDFWGQSYSRDEVASGSGIIIGENDTELLVVTNNHVVDDANTLQVQFIDGAVVEAQVKGVDSAVDLAVLAVKLEDIEEETKGAICIAQMGDSDNLKIGEPAIAIGNALGYGQSVTTGVISALNRTLEVSEDGTSNALIQTDAAINPGNSGGALLNINGEVVGINSSKIGASVVEGMGYAIPISTAKPIIEELMTHETRLKVADEDKGYLGISCINVTSEITENFSMPEGIFVAQVYEDTGADRAGLVRGDIITAVNGVTVKNQEELTKQLSYYKAGETVEITIMQGSPTGFQAKNVQVTLSTYDELNESSRRSQEEEVQEQSGSRTWRLP